jgi:hypothetical protein
MILGKRTVPLPIYKPRCSLGNQEICFGSRYCCRIKVARVCSLSGLATLRASFRILNRVMGSCKNRCTYVLNVRMDAVIQKIGVFNFPIRSKVMAKLFSAVSSAPTLSTSRVKWISNRCFFACSAISIGGRY